MGATQVHLDSDMQQIIADSMTDGECRSPEEAILLALRHWRSARLASSIGGDEFKDALQTAAMDTRPGKPAEEVFETLIRLYRNPAEERHAADAA